MTFKMKLVGYAIQKLSNISYILILQKILININYSILDIQCNTNLEFHLKFMLHLINLI